MSPLGKLSPEALEASILPHLGASRDEVLYGPGPGRDAAVIRIGAGRVLAMTTDPVSLVPALGAHESGRMSCHLVASDLWTTGIPPAYAAVTLNLPPSLPDAERDAFVAGFGEACSDLGVAVVTGHTGSHAGCDLTVIGAATLSGVGDEGRWVGTPFVQAGDRVILTKGAAIEATAIAARLFPGRMAERLDEEGVTRARLMLAQVSVVADCRAALRVGVRDRGVAALHDATEGGVLGGLLELARACRLDLRVTRSAIPISAEARAACELFGIDPYWTLSEGTLIIAARPAHVAAILEALADEGILAVDIGEVMRGSGSVWVAEPDGSVTTLTRTEPDPYWPAYDRAVRERWS
jgi:hydrogenase maturation factor